MRQRIVTTTLALLSIGTTFAFLPVGRQQNHNQNAFVGHRQAVPNKLRMMGKNNDESSQEPGQSWIQNAQRALQTTIVATGLALATTTTALPTLPAGASDSGAIVSCLLDKCRLPLAKCIANPKCMANVVCINTCNGKEDETGCQIQCGDLFENEVVGEFNKCVVSEMQCVPQKQDAGEYPVPQPDALVSAFDTKLFQGRWYITAGQNPLFDVFPCQVHFFENTAPGTFYGKLNWRVEEPDGEFFTRDALQRFVQDPQQPGLLMNHDNEYLHYQDDWYILDYEYDNNKDGVPPFALVYYRGSNDAWDGYGGAVVYTRDSKLPTELLPRLRAASAKVGMDFDKDFKLTDNTCRSEPSRAEKFELRERFAGKVLLQTEQQLQAQATRVRGNAVNAIRDEETLIEKEFKELQKATQKLEDRVVEFEQEIVREVQSVEREVIKDTEMLFTMIQP